MFLFGWVSFGVGRLPVTKTSTFQETDSPKTPFWTTVSPYDPFAAPLARPQFVIFAQENTSGIICKMLARMVFRNIVIAFLLNEDSETEAKH